MSESASSTTPPETPDSLEREFELFEQLSGLDEPSRRAQLTELAKTDAKASRNLEKLLLAHQQSGSGILDGLSEWERDDADDALPSEVSAGDQIGQYKILQLIGEGGMGQVFMARQEHPIERRVAIKMLHRHLNSKNVLARFEAERAALSRLDHEGIARILDAGKTETERSYFVMELVRGKPVTEYCDHERLEVRQRLELFEELCRAIHHAHQKGIIHRDIKPSNVLVAVEDGMPRIKVIDFGIAKAVDEPLTHQTLFTRFGELIGTPVYMSPEQLQSGSEHVDIRSDVYALGALLNELLTGFPPFQIGADQSLLQTLEQLRDAEPTRPSMQLTTTTLDQSSIEAIANRRCLTSPALQKSLRGELDWICIKALEKVPSQRYDSAAALGADVRRFLDHEPIEAAAPTLVYKISKLYRRHRSVCILSALSLLTLLCGAAVSGYLAVSAHYANQRLTRQSILLEQEIESRTETERRLQQAQTQAKKLARQRQNEAATERAISKFLFSSATLPQDLGTAMVVAAEQRSNFNQARKQNQNPTGKSKGAGEGSVAPVIRLEAQKETAFFVDILPEGVQSDIKVPPLEQSDFKISIQGDMDLTRVDTADSESTEFAKSNQKKLAKQRIRLLRLIEAQQRTEFGDADPLVGNTLFERASAHQQVGQLLESELAATKALAIFEQIKDAPSGSIEACQKLLTALNELQKSAAKEDL